MFKLKETVLLATAREEREIRMENNRKVRGHFCSFDSHPDGMIHLRKVRLRCFTI